jgi:Zn-dependent protease with chaperone function
MAGESVACPHCGDPLDLVEPERRPENGLESSAGGAGEVRWTASDLALGFRGRMKRGLPPLRYQAALGLVTVAMLVLPVSYLALVFGVGGAVVMFATRWFRWMDAAFGAREMVVVNSVVYVLGLLAGGLVLVFLVKPLLARPVRRSQPLALSPSAEPLLFAFLGMVCDTVGAPHPVGVEVDCRLNASARYRGGGVGLVRGDLVVTLGLPLVAALSVRQLAGVMAHEFGHFGQRFGMRASALVRAVNGWLARVAGERDGWDETLEIWVHGASDWRLRLVGGMAKVGVGGSRAVLRGLRRVGHAVSCLLLREMEREADRCEVAVAGSAAFEATRRRLRTLNEVARGYYQALRAGWDRNRSLPENFPRGMAAAEAALSAEERAVILERADRREARWFDTHPPDAERIARARGVGAEGLFVVEGPASALFADFDVVARQATVVHYEDDLGLERGAIRLVP